MRDTVGALGTDAFKIGHQPLGDGNVQIFRLTAIKTDDNGTGFSGGVCGLQLAINRWISTCVVSFRKGLRWMKVSGVLRELPVDGALTTPMVFRASAAAAGTSAMT